MGLVSNPVDATVSYIEKSFDPKKGEEAAGWAFLLTLACGAGRTAMKIAAAAPIKASQWLCQIP